jgi:RHH-type rel operon transcriptional repressor/antitoxin RelB
MIAVRLTGDIEQRLAALALATERPKSFYVRKAIEAYLDDHEDYLLALAVKQRIASGHESTYSLEEVTALLQQKKD